MLLTEHEQVVEALATHAPEEALADGVRPRGSNRCLENSRAHSLRHAIEVLTKLVVAIADDEAGSEVVHLTSFRPTARRTFGRQSPTASCFWRSILTCRYMGGATTHMPVAAWARGALESKARSRRLMSVSPP
jgi:hypothetical protein